MTDERPASSLRPIPIPVLREQVTDAIRAAIGGGTLRPGERVREAELAEQLGVSRLPIREAIRQLEHEGLLVSQPRRGTFVATITEQDIAEIFSLRSALEGLAGRLLAPCITADDLTSLQRVVADMRRAISHQDVAALLDLDAAFHSLLCSLAAHKRLYQHWKLLDSQWRTLVALDREHRMVVSLDRYADIHQVLVDALASRDPDRAQRAIHEHLAAGQVAIEQVLMAVDGPAAATPVLDGAEPREGRRS